MYNYDRLNNISKRKPMLNLWTREKTNSPETQFQTSPTSVQHHQHRNCNFHQILLLLTPHSVDQDPILCTTHTKRTKKIKGRKYDSYQ